MGEVRGVQRSITVELTFLGKFDVAGEYLASEKKMSLCPVDIRATTDVDCLVLTVPTHCCLIWGLSSGFDSILLSNSIAEVVHVALWWQRAKVSRRADPTTTTFDS